MGEAGVDVGLAEGEEGVAGGVLRGLDGLGDLVEGLTDAGVGAAHCGDVLGERLKKRFG